MTTTGFDASNDNFIGDYNWQASVADAVLPIFVGGGFPRADTFAQEVFLGTGSP